jgi:hypothetical protein
MFKFIIPQILHLFLMLKISEINTSYRPKKTAEEGGYAVPVWHRECR